MLDMLLKQTPRHVEKALCSLSGPYEESSAIIFPHTSEAGCVRVNSMKKKRELAEKSAWKDVLFKCRKISDPCAQLHHLM